MGESKTVCTPPAMWAQRNNLVFFTISVEDCKDPVIKLEPSSLYFRGVSGGGEKKDYELTVELYGEIDPATSTHTVLGREIEFVLKKTKDGFWPRLTKSSSKHHWLKVNFSKWKDEDDVSEEENDFGGGMPGMPGMGGMGGMGGMPGMGGDMDFESMMKSMGGLNKGGKANMDGLDDEPETDSDDEEALPELE